MMFLMSLAQHVYVCALFEIVMLGDLMCLLGICNM